MGEVALLMVRHLVILPFPQASPRPLILFLMLFSPKDFSVLFYPLRIRNIRILSISGSLALTFLEKSCHGSSQGRFRPLPKPSFKCPCSHEAFHDEPLLREPSSRSVTIMFLCIYLLYSLHLKEVFFGLLCMCLFSFLYQAPPPDRMQVPYMNISLSVLFSLSLSLSFCYQNLGKPVHRVH